MSTGIYCLRFTGTDKVYIGKSVNLAARKYSHEWQMKNQKSAIKLQSAYNLYGMPEFIVLCNCSENELAKLEQELIIEFDSIENGFNYSAGGEAGNISPGETNSRAIASNDKYLEALELLVYTTFSRYDIAKLTGLTVSIVSHISSGEGHIWMKEASPDAYSKLLSIKAEGRVKRTHNSKRPFNILVSPEGIKYNMMDYNLKSFCTEHNLTYSKVSGVLNGHSLAHKGWTALNKKET